MTKKQLANLHQLITQGLVTFEQFMSWQGTGREIIDYTAIVAANPPLNGEMGRSYLERIADTINRSPSVLVSRFNSDKLNIPFNSLNERNLKTCNVQPIKPVWKEYDNVQRYITKRAIAYAYERTLSEPAKSYNRHYRGLVADTSKELPQNQKHGRATILRSMPALKPLKTQPSMEIVTIADLDANGTVIGRHVKYTRIEKPIKTEETTVGQIHQYGEMELHKVCEENDRKQMFADKIKTRSSLRERMPFIRHNYGVYSQESAPYIPNKIRKGTK